MYFFSWFVFLLMICGLPAGAIAQQDSLLHLEPVFSGQHSALSRVQRQWKGKKIPAADLEETTETLLRDLHRNGFLAASADSVVLRQDSVIMHLYTGPQFATVVLARIKADSTARWFLPRNLPPGNEMSPAAFYDLQKKWLTAAENNGYPFARATTLLQGTSAQKAYYQVSFEAGPLLRYDSLQLTGSAVVSKTFLEKYLRLKQGRPYSRAVVSAAAKRLEALPWLDLAGEPLPWFNEGKAGLRLPLQKQAANEAEGILGLAPNGDKNVLTGELRLAVYSPLRRGSQLFLHWQRLQPTSPAYNFSFYYPFVLGSPLSLQVKLQSFKQDSSFFNLDRYLGAEWEAGLRHRLFAGLRFSSSRTFSTTNLLAPEVNTENFTKNMLAFGYVLDSRNHFRFPERGWFARLEVQTGQRRRLTGDPAADSLFTTTATSQWQVQAQLERFLKMPGAGVLAFKLAGSKIFADDILLNEAFRPGISGWLRGYPPGIFFTDAFVTHSLEWRLQTFGESFVYAFTDQAFISNKLSNFAANFVPVSIGAGGEIAMGEGIVKLVYGYGFSTGTFPGGSTLQAGYISRF